MSERGKRGAGGVVELFFTFMGRSPVHVHRKVECARATKGGDHFLGAGHGHICCARDQRAHSVVVDLTDDMGPRVDPGPIIEHVACMHNAI